MNPKDLGCKCDECPLNGSPSVLPSQVHSPRQKHFTVLGEMPTKADVEQKQFLSGNTGKLWSRRILDPLRIKRSALHITSAVLCWPNRKLSPTEWKKAIESCRERLSKELSLVKPRAVIAYGGNALNALTGKSSMAQNLGSPIFGSDFYIGGRKKGTKIADFSRIQVIPTFQPAILFRKWEYLPVVRIHTWRAFKLSRGQLPKWEWGPMELMIGKKMLAALQRIYRSSDPIAVDLEWVGATPFVDRVTCIGFANQMGAVSVPWDDHKALVGVSGGRNTTERKIRALTLKLLQSNKHLKIFQNGIADRMVMRHKEIPHAPPYWDLLHAHMIISPGTEHNLAFQAAVETHAPRWKEEFRGQRKDRDKTYSQTSEILK